MTFTIYKPGQGYWARMLTAVSVGVVTLATVAWLWNVLQQYVTSKNLIYIQASICVGILAVVGLTVAYILNKPRVVDFLIATEAEMRKVNWPSRRELIGSTWIVICGTFLLAAFMFITDLGFVLFFQKIGVLGG